jgi:hypothetical protein
MRREVKARGGVIVHEDRRVGFGGQPDLYAAVEAGREHGATILLFETVDRCKRPAGFWRRRKDGKKPYDYDHNAPMLEWDLLPLRFYARAGLTLMTVEPPDASPGRNRAAQTRRGQAAKGRKGGRPPKVLEDREAGYRARRKKQAMLKVRSLLAEECSKRVIAQRVAREFKVSLTTAYKWLREALTPLQGIR